MGQADPEQGLREEAARGSGQEWRAVLLRLLAALLVLGGIYVGAAFYFQDRPPAGVSVAGVEIGSLTREEAVEHLDRQLEDVETAPVTVSVQASGADGQAVGEPVELTLDPTTAGLSHDYEETLEGVTGFSLDPRDLWAHVSRTDLALPLVGAVDEQALRTAVEDLASEYDEEPVEGEVTLEEATVKVVDSAPGRQLDVDGVVAAVSESWPMPERATVEATAASVPPLLTAAEVERFTAEEIGPALDGPIVVTAKRGEGEDAATARAEVPPREIAEMLTIERGADHTLSLALDEKAMLSRLRQDLGQLERGPVDATVRLDGDDVKVVGARAGAELDTEALMADVGAALTASGEGRTLSADVVDVQPQVTTEVAEGWTFEVMGSFDSEFPGGEVNVERSHNIRTAIAKLNGVVVMPGEQFSLGAAISPITAEGGYHEAPVIMDGRLVMGMGGGLSQVSTTVFNASWFSGVQLDAHTTHSFYIPRYPAGREATISYPGLDNLWTNDTDTPVVIRTWTEGQWIHMEYLGQRQYDVQTIEGERVNIVEPQHIVDDSPSCVTQVASPGFSIYTARVLSQGGEVVHRDEFTTSYIPEDEVVCTHPDAD